MPLQILELASTPVSDLTPLQGIPLTSLQLLDCDDLRDCSPLKVCLSRKSTSNSKQNVIRSGCVRSRTRADQWKARAEFWKEVASIRYAESSRGPLSLLQSV